jgi:hypothetical protein
VASRERTRRKGARAPPRSKVWVMWDFLPAVRAPGGPHGARSDALARTATQSDPAQQSVAQMRQPWTSGGGTRYE